MRGGEKKEGGEEGKGKEWGREGKGEEGGAHIPGSAAGWGKCKLFLTSQLFLTRAHIPGPAAGWGKRPSAAVRPASSCVYGGMVG